MLLANIRQKIIILNVQCAALIQQIEHTLVQGIQEFDDLDVISKIQLGNDAFESLFLQSSLFVDEDLLQVDLMDLLVSIVHAQLFETIVIEHFEAVYIQKLDVAHVFFIGIRNVEFSIQFFNQPVKQTLIDSLRHGVSALDALSFSKRAQDQISSDSPAMRNQGLIKLLPLYSQQVCHILSNIWIPDITGLVLPLRGGVEVDVADEQHCSHQRPDLIDHIPFKLQSHQRLVQLVPHLPVVNANVLLYCHLLRDVVEVLLAVGVAGAGLHPVGGALLITEVGDELVEDVEVALAGTLPDDPALLQEVVLDSGVVNLHVPPVDLETDQLAEPARVVVLYGLGIPEDLEDGVALQDHGLQVGSLLVVHVQHAAAAEGNGAQGLLVGLRLSRTRLAANADDLRLFGVVYVPQDLEHEGENVGFLLANVLTLDEDAVEVARQALVRVLLCDELKGVDDDEAVPQTGVDLVLGQSPLQLHEHFRCIDDVHFNEVLLEAVAVPAALQLMRLHFEGGAVLSDARYPAVGPIDRQRHDALNHSPDEDVGVVLVGEVDPAARLLDDPADVEGVLPSHRLKIGHLNYSRLQIISSQRRSFQQKDKQMKQQERYLLKRWQMTLFLYIIRAQVV